MAQLTFPQKNFGNLPIFSSGDNLFKIGPVLDAGGTAIDLSAWNTIGIDFFNPNPVVMNNVPVFSAAVATGNSDGTINLKVMQSATLGAGVKPGTFNMTVTGKVTSGDATQMIGTGTATVGVT